MTRAAISEATLANPGASATTTARPVERTAAQTVSSSNGTIDAHVDDLQAAALLAAATSAAASATGTAGRTR